MSRPVLQLSSEHGWRGGERQVLLLSQGLARRGIEVVIAAPAGSPLAVRALAAGLEVLGLGRGRSLSLKNVLRIHGWLGQHPGAILHAQTSPALDWAAACRLLARAVWSRRSWDPAGIVLTRRVAFPVRRSRKYRTRADQYVAISRAVADRLTEAGLDPARLEIIMSAVEPEPLERARPGAEQVELLAGMGARARVVGCVGQMTTEKGHATLIRAWAEVLGRYPEARLILVGDGPERERIEQLIAASGIPGETVVLTGFRDDVPAWLCCFDLYVQPSLEEGLGTSVLDAMACGLPTVVSRTGGLPEVVVEHETGLLVPPADPVALAAAMLELLESPETAAGLGRAGRLRVEQRFSVEAMVSSYISLYQSLSVCEA